MTPSLLNPSPSRLSGFISLEWGAQYPPCVRDDDGEQVYDSGDSGDADSDEDEGAVLLKKCEAPFGFVICDLPVGSDNFIPDKDAKKPYVLLCCDSLDWKLGKIVKFKPRAKKFNFEVQWSSIIEHQQLLLSQNYDYDADATPVPGDWVYLKKA